jgi:hypothetical protein
MNSSGRKKIAFAIAVIILAFLGIGMITLMSRGVDLLVINDGHSPIKDLKLEFTGGTKSISELAPGGEYHVRINPKSESHLEVKFMDSGGLNHKEIVDVYMERNYHGKLTVRIDRYGKVSWQDDTKI